MVAGQDFCSTAIDANMESWADELLQEWYSYSKKWRPELGYLAIAPYCLNQVSNRQYEETWALAQDALYCRQIDNIEWCINELPTDHEIALGKHLRAKELNVEAGRNVWRANSAITYADVIEKIIPIMKRRGCFI